VIDFIFLGMSCTQVFYCIEPDLRWLSDYNFLIANLPIALENICVCKIVLKYNSEEEVVFLLSVSERLSQLDFYILDSIAGLNLLSKVISELFTDC